MEKEKEKDQNITDEGSGRLHKIWKKRIKNKNEKCELALAMLWYRESVVCNNTIKSREVGMCKGIRHLC